MIQKGDNYIDGSAARKLEYNVYEENKVLKAKKKQRSYALAKFKTILMVLVLFAGCFLIIFRYALLTELNYNLEKATKQYNTIKSENDRLKVDINKEMDLDKIKEIAVTRLGMQKPDKYQIVYVNVQKNDFTEVADAYKGNSNSNTNTLASFLDKVGKFAQLLN